MRLSEKTHKSMILEPTEIFLMSLARTSGVKEVITIGDFSGDLILFDDSGSDEGLFLFMFHGGK